MASSAADVTTQVNAGSASAVTSVATDLNRVVSSGGLAVSLVHAEHALPCFALQYFNIIDINAWRSALSFCTCLACCAC